MSELVSEATQAEEGSFCTEVNPISRNHYQRAAPTFGLTISNTQRMAAINVRRLVRPRHFLISVLNENPMATSATNTGNTMTQTGCQGGSLTLGRDR